MAISPAPRAARGPAIDYAEQITDEVRQRIAAEQRVLDEVRDRRNKVFRAAESFSGALRSFPSGSLAHGTVNDPVSDGDGGLVLDRRSWPDLGPDGIGEGPDDLMIAVGEHVARKLRREYPLITFTMTKRADMFEFFEPIGDEDPSIDLVLCLTRRERPGFWIPNREKARGWDGSDPEQHTALMTGSPRDLRVHRARAIRLAKAAIKNDQPPVLVPWNISAIALGAITQTGKLSETLAELFEQMSRRVAAGCTPDPAKVAEPIKLPDGISHDRAARRLGFFAERMREAIEYRHDHARALEALGAVFPKQLPEAPRSRKQKTANLLRQGATSSGVASTFGTVSKELRSFGSNNASA